MIIIENKKNRGGYHSKGQRGHLLSQTLKIWDNGLTLEKGKFQLNNIKKFVFVKKKIMTVEPIIKGGDELHFNKCL